MTTDLVTWLRGVLDEIDRVVRAKLGDPYGCWWLAIDEGAPSPDSVLADIAAKRAILDLAEKVISARDEKDENGVLVSVPIARARMRDVVRLLASAYADRPGYREEWRP